MLQNAGHNEIQFPVIYEEFSVGWIALKLDGLYEFKATAK